MLHQKQSHQSHHTLSPGPRLASEVRLAVQCKVRPRQAGSNDPKVKGESKVVKLSKVR